MEIKNVVNGLENASMPLRRTESRSKPTYATDLTTTTLGTFTGLIIDPTALEVDKINIEDISHSLSMQCRFGGHTSEFYSVAQHCVEVSKLVSEKNALWGLLHDASEAYLCDLPTGVKNIFPEFRVLEKKILKKIAERFNLEWPIPAEVKDADRIALVTEASKFHKVPVYDYKFTPQQSPLLALSPSFAKRQFIDRYAELVSNA